jgi:hypothetical protein
MRTVRNRKVQEMVTVPVCNSIGSDPCPEIWARSTHHTTVLNHTPTGRGRTCTTAWSALVGGRYRTVCCSSELSCSSMQCDPADPQALESHCMLERSRYRRNIKFLCSRQVPLHQFNVNEAVPNVAIGRLAVGDENPDDAVPCGWTHRKAVVKCQVAAWHIL